MQEVMSMSDKRCPLCNYEARSSSYDEATDQFFYDCKVCGMFFSTNMFINGFSASISPADKAALSGYIHEMTAIGKTDIIISSENVFDILNNPIIARSIIDKLKKLILCLYRHTNGLGVVLSFDPNYDFATCYAINSAEFEELLQEASRRGYVDIVRPFELKLTYAGVVFAEKLIKETPISNSAFVAMWFSSEMKEVFETAIKPAIEAKECGTFKAFRVDNHEHNNDITDEIIAGIKACRFMVADLTGYRGGVYYEAGFARGLGKPVIYTCRKDWFDGELSPDGKQIKERIHFDINHQNIIVWEDPEDLKQRIINRIRATIL